MINYKLFLDKRREVEDLESEFCTKLRPFLEHFRDSCIGPWLHISEIVFYSDCITVDFGYQESWEEIVTDRYDFPTDILEDHSAQRAEEFAKQFKADKIKQEEEAKLRKKKEKEKQMQDQIKRLEKELEEAKKTL